MRLFVSYARPDRPQAESLVRRIQQLGHETWLDSKLEGGQAWWDEILSEVRRCDAFALALSEASIESEACSSERAYAAALGKTVIPITVAPVRTQLLPSDLAGIQLVDYSEPGEDAAIELAKSLSRLAPSPPVPDPLPSAPPVPTSYLSDLGRRVAAPTLSRDEQLALVEDLRQGLLRARNRNNQEDYDTALDLLRRLRERPDLYAATAQQIDAVYGEAPRPQAEPAGPKPPVTVRDGQETAPKPKRSRWVTVLAVIGGIFLLLIAIASCLPETCYDPFGNPYSC
jgi:TIR domain